MSRQSDQFWSLTWWACVLATIVFVAMKLCGAIAWSWWAVASPVVGYVLLTLALFAIARMLIVLDGGQ